jgi:membrane protease YdiL (CAAX protease family)
MAVTVAQNAHRRWLTSAFIFLGLLFLLYRGLPDLHPRLYAQWVRPFWVSTRVAEELFRNLFAALFFWSVFKEYALDRAHLRILLLVLVVWVSLSSLPFREWAGAQFLVGWTLLAFTSSEWRSRWFPYLTLVPVSAYIVAFGPFDKAVNDWLAQRVDYFGKGFLNEHVFLSLCLVPVFYGFVCGGETRMNPLRGFARALAIWTLVGVSVDSSLGMVWNLIATGGQLPRAEDILWAIRILPHPLFLPLLFFISAFVEELLFRGLLFSLLEERRKGAGWILSAIAFCVVHPDKEWWEYPFLFASAVLFTYIRVRSNSLVPGTVAHAVGNLVSLLPALPSAPM